MTFLCWLQLSKNNRKGIGMANQETSVEKKSNNWAIDKHIPIAVIIAMLFQTAAFVWYTASFTSDTNNRLKNLEEYRVAASSEVKALPEKITRLEVEQAYTNRILAQILSEIRIDKAVK
jgi:hypothetical protein